MNRTTAYLVALCCFTGAACQKSQAVKAKTEAVNSADLLRYHHTDQGTRILPAAFLAALKLPDGSSQLMSPVNLQRWGFLYDQQPDDTAGNPYRWPVGFTVTDASLTNGIPIAGITCAACHTGQIEYHGTPIRIEGGQSNLDLPLFQGAVFASIAATAKDPERAAAFFKDAAAAGYPAERVQQDFRDVAQQAAGLVRMQRLVTGTSPGPGRVDAVQGIANAVFSTALKVPANMQNYDAPVSYPYIWDIWRLSWLQYNGFLPPQALSRNIGETLGTSGRMNFLNPVTGALNPVPARWQTSVNFRNLIWMESVIRTLKAPEWPESVLGNIDRTKAAAGRRLFEEHCSRCHGIRELPNGNWDVSMIPLAETGTDPNQARNWAGRTYDASKLGMGTAVPASRLGTAINAIRQQFYEDSHVPASEQEPDVKLEAPCGYKARPLIGVWATPPFLHNGSVRTVFDLLSDNRPSSFRYGSREYDPVQLGYREDSSASAVTLDTRVSGNSNQGHWFTSDEQRSGRIGPQLSDQDKYSIIEFLKSATYQNYPAVKVQREAALPCADDSQWARRETAAGNIGGR